MLVRLARRHNPRQQEACLIRPNPPPSPRNLGLVVVLAPLAPLAQPLGRDLGRLASNSSSSSNHSNNLPGPGLVRLVKPNHSNRPASDLAVSAPLNHSSRRVVSSVIQLSVKNPRLVDSVRMSYAGLFHVANILKALQLRAPVLSVLVPEPSDRLNPKLTPASEPHLNNPRPGRSVRVDLVPVSSEMWYLSLPNPIS